LPVQIQPATLFCALLIGHKVKDHSYALCILGEPMAKVKEHLQSVEEFNALGAKEFEEGRRKGNLA
jgi:hypothetical protein